MLFLCLEGSEFCDWGGLFLALLPIALVLILVVSVLAATSNLGNAGGSEIESSHLIRRNADGYPLTVNENQLQKAIETGDYTLEQKNFGGGHYSHENTWIPEGCRVKDEHSKNDRGLGK